MALAALLLSLSIPAFATSPLPPGGEGFRANECAGDRYYQLHTQDLSNGCTSNDVQITNLNIVGNTASCVGGTTLPLDFQVTVNFGADNRYDVGVFLANDGKDPTLAAIDGGASSCSVAVLPNSSPFLDLNPGPFYASDKKWYLDTCGDGNKAQIGNGTGSGVLYMSNVTVQCQANPAATGADTDKLYVPFVVSWDNNATPSPDVCQSNLDPVPPSSSKCNSPTVEQGTVNVVVLPKISNSDGVTYVTSGSSVTYAITISNTTGVDLSNLTFTDALDSTLSSFTGVTCSSSAAGLCPSGISKSALGSGITIANLPNGDTMTFDVTATLKGTAPNTVTNTATVAVSSGQSNSASDTDTFYSGALALSPSSAAQNVAAGNSVTYTYTLYNFNTTSSATDSLSATSSQGWPVSLSNSTVTVPAASGGNPGSATFTLTVTAPSGTAVGTVDTTTISAISGSNSASATAVSTVADLLTFTPDNRSAGGPAASVDYNHTVQNNDSAQQTVTFSIGSFTLVSGSSCSGWSVTGLYDKATGTELSKNGSGDYIVNLAANGGSENIVARVSIPATAQQDDECKVAISASDAVSTASPSVTDDTIVKKLILYADAGSAGSFTNESYIYPQGNNVYAMAYGLTSGDQYYFTYTDPYGTVHYANGKTTPNVTTANGTTAYDGPAFQIPTSITSGPTPEGTWQAAIYQCTSTIGNGSKATCDTTTGKLISSAAFYVGPDHVKASYTGSTASVGGSAIVDLSLQDINNQIPMAENSSGTKTLVQGNPPTTKDPLKVTVSVNGSALITAVNGVALTAPSQSVNLELANSTSTSPSPGTATITITDSTAESVTVSPTSYNGALYGSTLSPSRDVTTSVPFAVLLDHFEIDGPSATGVTCAPTTLTIKACADSSCSTPYTGGVTGTLAATTVNGTPTVNWSGGSGFDITSGNSWVTKEVQVTTAGEVAFGAASSSSSITPVNATTCNVGGTGNCDFSASTSGFLVSVPNHVAAAGSQLTLQAVSGTTTGVCVPAFQNQSKIVNLQCSYSNPGSGTESVSVDGTSLGCGTSGTGVSLYFDSNGIARNPSNTSALPSLQYDDVGEMAVSASYTGTSGTEEAGLSMTGSGSFVTRPDHFNLSAITCQDGTNLPSSVVDASSNKFCKAGEPFSVTVTAENQAGNPTPNFGKEKTPETVTLSNPALTTLTLAHNPALTLADGTNPAVVGTGTTDSGNFSGGGATATVAWDEVGIINLTPSLTSGAYIGTGNVTGTSTYVGRFYPYRFLVTPTATPACSNTFTYAGLVGTAKTGQPFTVNATATAQGQDQTTSPATWFTTQNYQGSFDKLPSSGSYGFTWTPVLVSPPSGTSVGTLSVSGTFTMAKGVGTFKPTSTTNATYAFAAEGQPESMKIQATVTDSDNVSGTGTDTTPVDYRFGRLTLNNADGSELTPLTMPLQTEYYGSNGYYQLNTDDSCTALSIGSDLQLSNPQTASGAWQSGTATMTIGNGSTTITSTSPVNFASGQASLLFGAPGGNNTGYVDVQTLLGTDFPWLLSDWNGDTTFSSNPKGRVTFGIFQGNPKDIYMRELY